MWNSKIILQHIDYMNRWATNQFKNNLEIQDTILFISLIYFSSKGNYSMIDQPPFPQPGPHPAMMAGPMLRGPPPPARILDPRGKY